MADELADVGAARRARDQERLRLFCFPYAGSGTSIYRGWTAAMPRAIEVWPVALPGREHRHTASRRYRR
jgi:surfactin synthase thioesterase subunit